MASIWISPLAVPLPDTAPAPARREHGRPNTQRTRPARAPVDPLRWHFYRRRAAAVVVLSVMVLGASTGIGAMGRRFVSSPGTQLGAVPDVAVVAHDAVPGETLWSLAVALGPSDDVRRSLDELTRLNGGSALVAGQPVRVPKAWYERTAR